MLSKLRVYYKPIQQEATKMEIKIKVDGKKYAQCEQCGVFHKLSKGKKNKKQVVCIKK